jgi:ribulose-phosphate 3-epimerase
MIPLVPAIIPDSQATLEALLPVLRFSPEIHIDVVDGRYVPFTSWPYQPAGEPMATKHLTDSYTLEVDLMVEDPFLAANDWLKAGADMLVFHTDNCTVAEFKKFIATSRVSVSIAATSDISLDLLAPYLEVADGVQLMGIVKVGSQGQSFATEVLARIAEVKKRFPKLPITIDGSVNQETIPALVEAGADRFICGSAIVKKPDPHAAYLELIKLTNN